MTSESRETSLKALLLPALVIASIYAHYIVAYRSYYPTGDDIAVLEASNGQVAKWFTEGFSKYFLLYPEWRSGFTDFLRPGFTLIMRLEHDWFGKNYCLYFACYYLAQFLLCAVVIAIARRFRPLQGWLYALGLMAALSPAFLEEGLHAISFQFDIWCGLFTLLAVYCIARGRCWLALLSLSVAVFTKETALYAPVPAAVAVYLTTRRPKPALAMLTPLVVWWLIWKFLFVGSTKGIYALGTGVREDLIGVGRGLLIWPTGVFDESAVRRILTTHAVVANLPDLLLLAINFALWGLLLALTLQLFSSFPRFDGQNGETQRLLLGLVIWLWGALAFGVLVAHSSRFGGSIYPLELIVCVATFRTYSSQRPRQLSVAALAMLALAFVWNAQGRLPAQTAPTGRSMRNLIKALVHNPAGVIYVLNSVPAYSNPASIAQFAGIPSAKVVILSEASGCSAGPAPPPAIREEGREVHISSVLPACAAYEFDEVPLEVLADGFHGQLARGNIATYSFPDGKIIRHGLGNSRKITDVDLGKVMDVNLHPDQARTFIILYYDWAKQNFVCAGEYCTTP